MIADAFSRWSGLSVSIVAPPAESRPTVPMPASQVALGCVRLPRFGLNAQEPDGQEQHQREADDDEREQQPQRPQGTGQG